MAIYFNLGIDCGSLREVAERVATHYRSLEIQLPLLDPAPCEVRLEHRRNLWFVGVWPEGMGWETSRICRPELATEDTVPMIREVLYAHLRVLTGYRRAIFGAEVFDMLLQATAAEDNDIDYSDMVFADALFPRRPLRTLVDFSPGYTRVRT